jgi:DNA-binding GntR family transcriptional regulator
MNTSASRRPPLDRTSPIPLYFQIAENLKEAIQAGAIAPGERLDNELGLAEQLGVSRPTVRQAIQRLVHEGLVVRRRGLGTVVVAPRILRPVALTSLYDDLAAATPVLSIERLRFADDTPLAIMQNYLPAKLLQGRTEADLEQNGLYELLRSQGVQLHAADQVLAARRVTAQEARLLQAPRSATVLTMTRTAFDPAGLPIEHGRHAYLADRYSFKMSLVAQ